MTWRPQPESTPDAMHPGSVVAGACPHHRQTLHHWHDTHKHEDAVEFAEREAHHTGSCPRCQGRRESTGLGRERSE